MIIDNNKPNHIIADDGMVFKRKNSNDMYGSEIYLGYSYYIDGIKLDEPHLDVPEDFEEVEKPIEDEMMDVENENSEFDEYIEEAEKENVD